MAFLGIREYEVWYRDRAEARSQKFHYSVRAISESIVRADLLRREPDAFDISIQEVPLTPGDTTMRIARREEPK